MRCYPKSFVNASPLNHITDSGQILRGSIHTLLVLSFLNNSCGNTAFSLQKGICFILGRLKMEFHLKLHSKESENECSVLKVTSAVVEVIFVAMEVKLIWCLVLGFQCNSHFHLRKKYESLAAWCLCRYYYY